MADEEYTGQLPLSPFGGGLSAPDTQDEDPVVKRWEEESRRSSGQPSQEVPQGPEPGSSQLAQELDDAGVFEREQAAQASRLKSELEEAIRRSSAGAPPQPPQAPKASETGQAAPTQPRRGSRENPFDEMDGGPAQAGDFISLNGQLNVVTGNRRLEPVGIAAPQAPAPTPSQAPTQSLDYGQQIEQAWRDAVGEAPSVTGEDVGRWVYEGGRWTFQLGTQVIPGGIAGAGSVPMGVATVQSDMERRAHSERQWLLSAMEAIDKGEAPPRHPTAGIAGPDPRIAQYMHGTAEARAAMRRELQAEVNAFTPTNVQDRAAYQLGESIQRYGQGLGQRWSLEGFDEKSIATQLGRGLGTMGFGLLVSVIPGIGQVAGAGTFTTMGMGEATQRAVEFDRRERAAGRAGLTQDQIVLAGMLGIAPGATDILPIEHMLGRLPLLGLPPQVRSLVARAIARIGGQAFVEGVQEGGQEFLQNLIEQQVYNPEKSLTEGVIPSAGLGAGVGGIAEGLRQFGGAAVGRVRRGGGRGGPAPSPEAAPETPPQQPSAPAPEATAPPQAPQQPPAPQTFGFEDDLLAPPPQPEQRPETEAPPQASAPPETAPAPSAEATQPSQPAPDSVTPAPSQETEAPSQPTALPTTPAGPEGQLQTAIDRIVQASPQEVADARQMAERFASPAAVEATRRVETILPQWREQFEAALIRNGAQQDDAVRIVNESVQLLGAEIQRAGGPATLEAIRQYVREEGQKAAVAAVSAREQRGAATGQAQQGAAAGTGTTPAAGDSAAGSGRAAGAPAAGTGGATAPGGTAAAGPAAAPASTAGAAPAAPSQPAGAQRAGAAASGPSGERAGPGTQAQAERAGGAERDVRDGGRAAQPVTEPTPDQRSQFRSLIASRQPLNWSAIGATPEQLQALQQEAVQEGLLRLDRNGSYRRTQQAATVPTGTSELSITPQDRVEGAIGALGRPVSPAVRSYAVELLTRLGAPSFMATLNRARADKGLSVQDSRDLAAIAGTPVAARAKKDTAFASIEKRHQAHRAFLEQQKVDATIRVTLASFQSASAEGESQAREFDAIGYYSKALEAAKAWPQKKGAPQQVIAHLKKAGVKDTEIEATGLAEFLRAKAQNGPTYRASSAEDVRSADRIASPFPIVAGTRAEVLDWRKKIEEPADAAFKAKRFTEQDVPVSSLRSFQVDLYPPDAGRNANLDKPIRVAKVGDDFIIIDGNHRAALALQAGQTTIRAQVANVSLPPTSVSKEEVVSFLRENRVEVREAFYAADPNQLLRKGLKLFGRGLMARGAAGLPKWSPYSLAKDDSNPTYRETVLHLPSLSTPEQRAFAAEMQAKYASQGATAEDWWAYLDAEDSERRLALQGREDDGIVFQSGHWSEPNVVSNIMSSLNKLGDKTTYAVSQVQSDWAQNIRDATRDALAMQMFGPNAPAAKARIAELEQRLAEVNAQIDAIPRDQHEKPEGTYDITEQVPYGYNRPLKPEVETLIDERNLTAGQIGDLRAISGFRSLSQEQKAEVSAAISEARAKGELPAGARDEKKVAELKKQFAEAVAELDKTSEAAKASLKAKGVYKGPGYASSAAYHRTLDGKTYVVDSSDPASKAAIDRASLLVAELRTAEAATPPHPLVNTTDAWLTFTLKHVVRQAVASGADSISIPSGATVLDYNPQGSEEGNAKFYDRIVPISLGKILKEMDKSIKSYKVDHVQSPVNGEDLGSGFVVFPITEKVRESVQREGMALMAISNRGFGLTPSEYTGSYTQAPTAQPVPNAPQYTDAFRASLPGVAARIERWARKMLPAEVAVRVVDRIDTGAQSAYAGYDFSEGPTGILGKGVRIALTTDAGLSSYRTLLLKGFHEVVHALREEGRVPGGIYGTLLTSQEWQVVLERAKKIGVDAQITYYDHATKKTRPAVPLYRRTYRKMLREAGFTGNIDQRVEELIDQERVAKLAEMWAEGTSFGRKIDGWFERVVQFIEAIRNAVRGLGFHTYEDVFKAMASGEIARRTDPGARREPYFESPAYDPNQGPDQIPSYDRKRFFPDTPSPEEVHLASDEGQAARGLFPAIRAFHGSPHDFDRFDITKIGTGEGAQAFGHGLYFAENQEVARSYTGNDIGGAPVPFTWQINGQRTTPGTPLSKAADLVSGMGPAKARKFAADMLAEAKAGAEWTQRQGIDYYQRVYDAVAAVKSKKDVVKVPGRLYEVSLDVEPEQLLDWDKPLSEQSEYVRKALKDAWMAHPESHANLTGADILRANQPSLTGDSTAVGASQRLKEAGIKGIRYLDQGSRTLVSFENDLKVAEGALGNAEWRLQQATTAEERAAATAQVEEAKQQVQEAKDKLAGNVTRNFVIFDDSLVKIVAKDGKPVEAEERADVLEQMHAEQEGIEPGSAEHRFAPWGKKGREAARKAAKRGEYRIGDPYPMGGLLTPALRYDGPQARIDAARVLADLQEIGDALGVPAEAMLHGGRLGYGVADDEATGFLGEYLANLDASTRTVSRDGGAVIVNTGFFRRNPDVGAGSPASAAAHEWWHSLSNYMGTVLARMPVTFAENGRIPDGAPMRPELREAFAGLMDALFQPDGTFAKEGHGDLLTDAYLAQRHEVAARAFQAYIADRLPYMALPDAPSLRFADAAEQARVFAAFDNLFATFLTRPSTMQGGSGMELYSLASGRPAPETRSLDTFSLPGFSATVTETTKEGGERLRTYTVAPLADETAGGQDAEMQSVALTEDDYNELVAGGGLPAGTFLHNSPKATIDFSGQGGGSYSGMLFVQRSRPYGQEQFGRHLHALSLAPGAKLLDITDTDFRAALESILEDVADGKASRDQDEAFQPTLDRNDGNVAAAADELIGELANVDLVNDQNYLLELAEEISRRGYAGIQVGEDAIIWEPGDNLIPFLTTQASATNRGSLSLEGTSSTSLIVSEQPDGGWELSFFKAEPETLSRLPAIVAEIEANDLGKPLSPRGWLTPEGYAYWQQVAPDKVRFHQNAGDLFGGAYASPRAIEHGEAILADAANSENATPQDLERIGAQLAQFRKLKSSLPPQVFEEARREEALGYQKEPESAAPEPLTFAPISEARFYRRTLRQRFSEGRSKEGSLGIIEGVVDALIPPKRPEHGFTIMRGGQEVGFLTYDVGPSLASPEGVATVDMIEGSRLWAPTADDIYVLTTEIRNRTPGITRVVGFHEALRAWQESSGGGEGGPVMLASFQGQGAPPPGGPPAGQPSLPVTPATQGAPRGITDIIADLKSALSMTTTQGLYGMQVRDRTSGRRWSFRPQRTVRGQYDATSGVARIRVATDIDEIARLGGEHIEQVFGADMQAFLQQHAEELAMPAAPDTPVPATIAPTGYSGIELDADTQRVLSEAGAATLAWRAAAAAAPAPGPQRGSGRDAGRLYELAAAAAVANNTLRRRLGRTIARALVADIIGDAPLAAPGAVGGTVVPTAPRIPAPGAGPMGVIAPASVESYVQERFSATGTPAPRPAPAVQPAELSDAFANFFRRFITDPDAAKRDMPGVFVGFEDFLDANDPAMLESIEAVQLEVLSEDYKAHRQATAWERIQADSASMQPKTAWENIQQWYRVGATFGGRWDSLKQWIGWVGSSISYTSIDATNTILKQQQAILNLYDEAGIRDPQGRPVSVRPSQDAHRIARMMAGADKIGHQLNTHGVPDYQGLTPIGPSLQEALVLALGGTRAWQWSKQAIVRFGSYLEARRAVEEWRLWEDKQRNIQTLDNDIEARQIARRQVAANRNGAWAAHDRAQDAALRNRTLLSDRRRALGVAETTLTNAQTWLADLTADRNEAQEAIDDGSDVARAVKKRKERSISRAEQRQREALREYERLTQEVEELSTEAAIIDASIEQIRTAAEQADQALAQFDDGTTDMRAELARVRQRGAQRGPTQKTAAEYAQAIVDAETANPNYRQAAQMVYDWQHRLLTMEWQAGKWSDEAYQELSTRKDWYVPFMRDLADLTTPRSWLGKAARKFTGPKRFEGSERAIINPIESMVKRAYETAASVQFNDMTSAFVTLAEGVPTGGRIAERVTKEEALPANAASFDAIRQRLIDEMGMDPADAQLAVQRMEHHFTDTNIEILANPDNLGPLRPPLVPLWEKGERKLVRLNDPVMAARLYDAMNALGREQSGILTRIIAWPAGVLRAGVTMHPAFIVSNILADMTSAFVITGNVTNPMTWPVVTQARGFWHLLSTNPTAQAMMRSVGITPSRFAQLYSTVGGISGAQNTAAIHALERDFDVRSLRQRGFHVVNVPSLGGLSAVGLGAIAGGVVAGPVGATVGAAVGGMAGRAVFGKGAGRTMAAITEASETATRLGVAAHAAARARRLYPHLSDIDIIREASFTATDVIDFNRAGAKAGPILKQIPFLNSNIQGVSKAYRQSLMLDGDRGRVNMSKARFFLRYQLTRSNAARAALSQEVSEREEQVLRDGARIWINMSILAMVGVSLAMAFKDDPEYEDVKREVRDTHFVFKLWGTWFRVKKPFELAQLANMTEAYYEWMWGNDPRLMDRIRRSFLETHMPPMVPQVYNLVTGWWTGVDPGRPFSRSPRQIVPEGLERLPPHLQYTALSSEFARAWSDAMNRIGVRISPVMIDWTLNNELAYWGREIRVTSDYVWSPRAPRWTEMPVIGTMLNRFRVVPGQGSASIEEFWALMGRGRGELDQAAAGYDQKLKEANPNAVMAYLAGLSREEVVYSVLQRHFSADDKRAHPMNRVKTITDINRAMRREMTEPGGLISSDAATRGRAIALSPAQRAQVDDVLARISALEAWNALHATGRPGWAQREARDPQPLLDELKAASASAYEEMIRRRERSHVGTWEADRQRWERVEGDVERMVRDQNLLGLAWGRTFTRRRVPTRKMQEPSGDLQPLLQ